MLKWCSPCVEVSGLCGTEGYSIMGTFMGNCIAKSKESSYLKIRFNKN